MADNRSFSLSFNRWGRAISAIERNAVPDPDPLSDVIDHAEDLCCVLVEQQAIVTKMTTADVQWKLMVVANIFDFFDSKVVDGTPFNLQPIVSNCRRCNLPATDAIHTIVQ
jgi:hypothetical protein